MLDKVIMLSFTMFLMLLFAFMAVTGLAMFNQWGMVQNQAQFLAASTGKWGGYTLEAERTVNEFAGRLNLPRDQVRVEVSDAGPVSWGTPLWVRVTIPFRFRVGRYNVGNFNLVGTGRSVSSYLHGAYHVRHTSP